MKTRESWLQNGIFIYKTGLSVTKQDFHLQNRILELQTGLSPCYLPDGNTDRDADQQKNHKSDEKDCHCTVPPLVCVGSVWDYNPIHKLVDGLNDDKAARDGHGQEMPGFGHKLHG